MEICLKGSDGASIAGLRWKVEQPKARLCVIHGLGEHGGRHEKMAEFMNEKGVDVWSIDNRGHGRNGGKRGCIPSYEQLLLDVKTLIDTAAAEKPACPVFLFGHSLGGNIVLNYILKQDVSRLSGAIVTSPWLILKNGPGRAKVAMMERMAGIFPNLTVDNGLKPESLCHDEDIVKNYGDDPLNHSRISLRLAKEAYGAADYALRHGQDLQIPLFLAHGEEDPICAFEGSQSFWRECSGYCEFHGFPGCYHELHNEPIAKELFAEEWAFIEKHRAGGC